MTVKTGSVNQLVTAHLQNILPLCDLVVGTEEWHIAGGTDTLAYCVPPVLE